MNRGMTQSSLNTSQLGRAKSAGQQMRIRPTTAVNSIRTILRRREEAESKLINLNIEKIDNENNQKFLLKMGEANDICSRLNLKNTFRVYNAANGSIVCNLYDADKRVTSGNVEFFDRE